MEIDIIGVAVIEIDKLAKKNLEKKEFRKGVRTILCKLIFDRTNRDKVYIKTLQEKVEDLMTIKRILNKQ